jgi:cation-transporting P-type ATPase E
VLESSSRVRGYTVGGLCAALFALYLVVLSLPGWRDFFQLAAPDPVIIIVSLVGTALAVTGLALTDERFLPGRPPPEMRGPPSGSAPA